MKELRSKIEKNYQVAKFLGKVTKRIFNQICRNIKVLINKFRNGSYIYKTIFLFSFIIYTLGIYQLLASFNSFASLGYKYSLYTFKCHINDSFYVINHTRDCEEFALFFNENKKNISDLSPEEKTHTVKKYIFNWYKYIQEHIVENRMSAILEIEDLDLHFLVNENISLELIEQNIGSKKHLISSIEIGLIPNTLNYKDTNKNESGNFFIDNYRVLIFGKLNTIVGEKQEMKNFILEETYNCLYNDNDKEYFDCGFYDNRKNKKNIRKMIFCENFKVVKELFDSCDQ